jgi:peroxiredoxin
MMLVPAKLVLALALSALAVGAQVPGPAAAIKMKSALDGKSVSIADVQGKAGTLVVFTCNHCPFARGWERRIADLANSYAKKGIGVILVSANDPAKYAEDDFAGMQARAKQLGLQVPYVMDETSAVARALGASVTPEAFLFDRNGKLAYHGTIDDNHRDAAGAKNHYLKDALDAVLEGRPAPVAETKGIGCGIKFR